MGRSKYKRKRERALRRAGQQDAQVHPLDNEVLSTENQEEYRGTGEHEGNREKEHSMRLDEAARRSSLTDWLLVLFTAVLGASAIYQFVIMRGQLDEMRIDQRAWLNVQVTGVQAQVGGNMAIPMKVTNTGKTPAKKVDGWVVVHVNPMDTPIDFRNPTTVKPTDLPKGQHMPYNRFVAPVVFPQDPVPFTDVHLLRTDSDGIHDEPWTQFMQDSYDRGDTYLEVHGEFPYIDAASTRHWTRFCRTLSKTKAVPIEISISCDEYADVDDNK